jgi:hypothetical protein
MNSLFKRSTSCRRIVNMEMAVWRQFEHLREAGLLALHAIPRYHLAARKIFLIVLPWNRRLASTLLSASHCAPPAKKTAEVGNIFMVPQFRFREACINEVLPCELFWLSKASVHGFAFCEASEAIFGGGGLFSCILRLSLYLLGLAGGVSGEFSMAFSVK